ncbi:MAG: hypothetical protein P8I84_01115 [Paracoccaceae bacterium]|nr:hypothetical protein [Paracoccaceae bacterium]MDG1879075.1 hypothetical protein [Paracoccaceae bacterium]
MGIFGEKKILNKYVFFTLIFGFFTFGVGYILALQFGECSSPHKHSHDHKESSNIDMGPNYVSLETYKNIVRDLELTSENSNNWKLLLISKGLSFCPEKEEKHHSDGENQVHLFDDGIKHSRLYSNWYHSGSVAVSNKTTLALNSNNHNKFIKGDSFI